MSHYVNWTSGEVYLKKDLFVFMSQKFDPLEIMSRVLSLTEDALLRPADSRGPKSNWVLGRTVEEEEQLADEAYDAYRDRIISNQDSEES